MDRHERRQRLDAADQAVHSHDTWPPLAKSFATFGSVVNEIDDLGP
jgi:hypothetical protein